MDDNERMEVCLNFFKNIKGKGKSLAGLDEAATTLNDEAARNGLDTTVMEVIIKVITEHDLRARVYVSLIKSLIPRIKVPDDNFEKMITFWFSKCNELPVTVSTIILQWFVGIWEYRLADRQIINAYYDCFFLNMLKKEKLESPIARLIYLMTKPDDVTRRQALRLLKVQDRYAKPQKHISVLLSLFKSYKPELVPEKIPTLNIESVWKPIPEVLRLGFEDAKTRGSSMELRPLEYFDWNTIKSNNGEKYYPLLPSIRYFQMGSSIYKDKDTKSVFDLINIDDVGKYHFNIELPTNATSLLANVTGYHFLTFSNFEYQCRFSHNLYNTLQRAFIVESDRFSQTQKEQLLDMTTEFCRYMQQGIPVVLRFLQEYISYESGEYRDKLLSLIVWSTSISPVELHNMSSYFETIFLESSLMGKCNLINSLGKLAMNIFFNHRFDREESLKPSPFLRQEPANDLSDIIPLVIRIADQLLIRGLNIHDNNSLLLNEGLMFYEIMNKLIKRCETPMLIIAPPAMIYGAFLSKSAAILSRVCGLLLDYRNISNRIHELQLQNYYLPEIRALSIYARDISNALWNDQVSLKQSDNFLFAHLTDKMIDSMTKNHDILLNINHHIATLPYKCTFNDTGLDISTKDAALCVSNYYFPAVIEFITSFQQLENDHNTI